MLRLSSMVNGLQRMMSRLAVLAVVIAATLPAPAPPTVRSTPPQLQGNEAQEVKRQVLANPHLRNSFPRMSDRNIDVLGPETRDYNCIAHTMGIKDRWVWPGETLADFDRLYATQGYRRI